MKLILPLLAFLSIMVSVSSCKKFIEDKKEEFVLNMLTNGNWKVESFFIDNTDSTVLFEEYKFVFTKTGIVNCINNLTTKSGTWKEDLEAYSITTHFPDAVEPLHLLNGEWKIIDGYFDYCEAKMNRNGKTQVMMLKKQ